jgi:hypothetical protein
MGKAFDKSAGMAEFAAGHMDLCATLITRPGTARPTGPHVDQCTMRNRSLISKFQSQTPADNNAIMVLLPSNGLASWRCDWSMRQAIVDLSQSSMYQAGIGCMSLNQALLQARVSVEETCIQNADPVHAPRQTRPEPVEYVPGSHRLQTPSPGAPARNLLQPKPQDQGPSVGAAKSRSPVKLDPSQTSSPP